MNHDNGSPLPALRKEALGALSASSAAKKVALTFKDERLGLPSLKSVRLAPSSFVECIITGRAAYEQRTTRSVV